MSAEGAPRGERNHNPGNLRATGIAWQGLATPPDDGEGYAVFVDDFHGLRALARDLYNKWSLDGLHTVEAIIGRYAPAGDDNNVSAYVRDVSATLGVASDKPLDLSIQGNLCALVRAVIRHENGRCIYSTYAVARATAAAVGPMPTIPPAA